MFKVQMNPQEGGSITASVRVELGRETHVSENRKSGYRHGVNSLNSLASAVHAHCARQGVILSVLSTGIELRVSLHS